MEDEHMIINPFEGGADEPTTNQIMIGIAVLAVIVLFYFYFYKQNFSLYSYINSDLPYTSGANVRYMSIDSSTVR